MFVPKSMKVMVQNNRRQVAKRGLPGAGSLQLVLMLQHQSYRANHSLSIGVEWKNQNYYLWRFFTGFRHHRNSRSELPPYADKRFIFFH